MVNELNKQLTIANEPNANLGLQPVKSDGTAPGANEAPPSSSTPSSTPATEGAPPKPAPAQVNEVNGGQTPLNSAPTTENPPAASPTSTPGTVSKENAKATDSKTDTKDESTSKKKSKKGLRKLIPF